MNPFKSLKSLVAVAGLVVSSAAMPAQPSPPDDWTNLSNTNCTTFGSCAWGGITFTYSTPVGAAPANVWCYYESRGAGLNPQDLGSVLAAIQGQVSGTVWNTATLADWIGSCVAGTGGGCYDQGDVPGTRTPSSGPFNSAPIVSDGVTLTGGDGQTGAVTFSILQPGFDLLHIHFGKGDLFFDWNYAVNNTFTINGLPQGISNVDAFWPHTTAVPEPETYAMMLAGLGLLGFAARRRRKASA